MIITQKKPIEELLAMLAGVKKVAIVGCANCAAACQTGGEKEVLEMKQLLEERGFEVVATVTPAECCHKMLVKKDTKILRTCGAEAVVGMACGDGCALLFKKGEILRKVPIENAADELFNEIENL